MSDQSPITEAEMRQLFGETLPMEAVQLLWSSPDEVTFGELRAKLRSIAHNRIIDTKLEKVARAICTADGQNPDSDWRQQGSVFLTVHDPHPEIWRRYQKQAEAAIKAISED